MPNILELKTVQVSAFKILSEALKDLLTDTCIEFDETGMKIIAMDNSHIVLVHLRLEASRFEYYKCEKPLNLGINMLNFYRLIKTVHNTDVLTLYMDENDINHLGIKIENGNKNTKTFYKLNLLDLDNPHISIDAVDFKNVITIPSSDFQKYIRDSAALSESIEIKNIRNQLVFSCKGDFCCQETVLCDNKCQNENNMEIVQGVFKLKYLVLFTKCTNLCNTVELYIKNDYPLILKYTVASLGEIKLAIAPSTSDI
jgi:proliferating cell nuclear antigen